MSVSVREYRCAWNPPRSSPRPVWSLDYPSESFEDSVKHGLWSRSVSEHHWLLSPQRAASELLMMKIHSTFVWCRQTELFLQYLHDSQANVVANWIPNRRLLPNWLLRPLTVPLGCDGEQSIQVSLPFLVHFFLILLEKKIPVPPFSNNTEPLCRII